MRLGKSIFCLSLVGLAACLGWSHSKSEGLRAELAVVERERLWRCHQGYSDLERLDWEVERLQSERLGLLLRAQDHCDRLFQQQEALRLWDVQRGQMQAGAEQATREFQARTEQEMKAVHARFERQMKAAVRVPDPDLRVMAAAAVMRFRLEKQKELGTRLQARRQQLDEAVVHFEDDLSRQFQAEKVRLRVKLELGEDEEARRRLEAIEEEVATRKAARRQLAETEMRDYTSIEEGQLAVEVRDYEQGLRRELQPATADLLALQRQERSQLKSVQQLRHAQLVEVVRDLEARARARFQVQLASLQERHYPAGEQFPEAFLEPKERARLHKLPDLIRQARRRREAVYARLSEGIARVVGQQAERRNLDGVITDVRLNLQLEDLTDVSLAGVSELKP